MPGFDHTFTTHRGDDILGGFMLCQYLGASMTIHMAGDDPRWCSKDLLWITFDYAFVQLGLRKLIAPVRSDNYAALALDLRAGWHIETIIRDVYDTAHMFVLTMTPDTCPWLKLKPRNWVRGQHHGQAERAGNS